MSDKLAPEFLEPPDRLELELLDQGRIRLVTWRGDRRLDVVAGGTGDVDFLVFLTRWALEAHVGIPPTRKAPHALVQEVIEEARAEERGETRGDAQEPRAAGPVGRADRRGPR